MMHVLIALNGSRLKKAVLNSAYALCAHLKCRIDILVVEARDEVPEALARFLERLQGACVDFRLVRAVGRMSPAVLDYARRHRGVDLILIDTLKSWDKGVPIHSLKQPVGVLASIAAV